MRWSFHRSSTYSQAIIILDFRVQKRVVIAAVRTMQLYGTAGATANAVAQITIPSSATIKAVQFAIAVDQVADNSHLALELSKVPTSQIAVNGAQDPFWEFRTYANTTTPSGNSQTGMTRLLVPCRQGEIIYLHAFVVTTTFYANFIFWF